MTPFHYVSCDYRAITVLLILRFFRGPIDRGSDFLELNPIHNGKLFWPAFFVEFCKL